MGLFPIKFACLKGDNMNNTATRVGMNFELERAKKANPELAVRAEAMVELYKDKLQPWSFFVVDNTIIYIGVTAEGKLRAEVESYEPTGWAAGDGHSVRNFLIRNGILKNMSDEIYIGNFDRGDRYVADETETESKAFQGFICGLAVEAGKECQIFLNEGMVTLPAKAS